MYQYKYRHIGQQNEIENPEIGSHIYGKLIFNKDTKVIIKKNRLSTSGGGRIGYPYAKTEQNKKTLLHTPTTYTN